MRVILLVLVAVHGLIHVMGFLKGFGVKDFKELTLPISKSMGLLWLTGMLLMLLYAVLFFLHNKHAWLVGLMAVGISQTLIILHWTDAKFGTIPNVIILIVCIMAMSGFLFQQQTRAEMNKLIRENTDLKHVMVRSDDLEQLPAPVKKWLQHCGMVGKSAIQIGRITQKAKMQMKPGQDKWLTAKAIQYSVTETPAFIWAVNAKMNAFLGFRGRDKFTAGKGEMLIKLNALIPIVNETGPKLDEGSLQRFLGEMVWFPSLALSPFITWKEWDDHAAVAEMSYQGTTGSGKFLFNEAGDFVRFVAARYKDNTADAQRFDWVLDVQEYGTFDGIRIPVKMTATWKLEEHDWTWLELEVTDMKYNENALTL